jgi:hypothetical protein
MPRFGSVTRSDRMFTRSDIPALSLEIYAVLSRARQTDSKKWRGASLTPYYDVCKYCGVSGRCVALRRIADDLGRKYDPEGYGKKPALPVHTHASEVTDLGARAQLQELASLMETWSASVRHHNLSAALDNPENVPTGYILDWVKGRRRVTSADGLLLVAQEFGITAQELLSLGRTPHSNDFNMTALAVRGSRHQNGVSRIHGGVSSEMLRDLWPQVPPDENAENWSDDQIWSELETRLGKHEGLKLSTGKITQKSVTAMRSYVAEPMRHGRLFLAGDSAHIVPPTGAKGMNLAISDVYVLSKARVAFYKKNDASLFETYGPTCLRRVWRAQHFSWWMTSMLHNLPDASPFDAKRQVAELYTIATSKAGQTLLAENYVGLPFET